MFRKLAGAIVACLLFSGIALAGFMDDGRLSDTEIVNIQDMLETAVADGRLPYVDDWFIDRDGYVVVFYREYTSEACEYAGVFEITSINDNGQPLVNILGKMECGKAILDIMKVGDGEWRSTHKPVLPEPETERPKNSI